MLRVSWVNDSKSASLGRPVNKEKGRRNYLPAAFKFVAPQVGLEPTTLRLTAECSAIELLRNKRPHIVSIETMCGRDAFL